jgi:replicative DNA helicase
MFSFKSVEVQQLSTVERKHSQFILKDILPLPAKTVNMISSSGGMGKTFISIRLANEFVRETGSRVLCWFSEDDNGEIAIRYDTLKKSGMIVKEFQDDIFLINSEPKQFALKEGGVFKANYHALDELKNDCLFNNIKLVIIDPLLAFYGGDENDNSQARIFMQPFIEWTKKFDITVLFIHHASKNGGTRGAGAFRDAVRTLYEMNYVLDAKGLIDFNIKDSGVREVSIAKDNRNAFYWFEKKYNGASANIQIMPRRIRVEEVEYKEEKITHGMVTI